MADVQFGDIMDAQAWGRALEDVEAVVHLAGASSNVPGVFETNVTSTRLMAQACNDMGVSSIVFASSSCVLGHCDRQGNPPFELDYLPVNEDHPLKPCSDYGLSKLVAEQVLHAAARSSGMRVVALRLAFVLLEDAAHVQAWRQFDEPWHVAHLWAYVYVQDCARAFRLAMEASLETPFQAMYISADDTLSDDPTSTLIQRHYPVVCRWTDSPTRYASLYSNELAGSLIGFRPAWSWRH